MKRTGFLSFFIFVLTAVNGFAGNAESSTGKYTNKVLSVIYVYIGLAIIAAASVILIINRVKKNREYKERLQNALSDARHAHQALMEKNAQIMALEDKFESLYDVELETGKYDIFIKGQTYNEEIKDRLLVVNEYFSDLYKNIDIVVYPEDRETLKKVMSKEAVIKALEEHPSFDHFYRVLVNGEPVWFKVRIVYKNEQKKNIIIGVFSAEDEVLKKQKDEKIRDELVNQMLGADSLYLIDCVNNTRRTIHDHSVGVGKYNDKESYTESVERYINNYVYPDDVDMLRELTSPDYMLKRTKQEKEYAVQFRDVSAQIQHFYEMRVVKLSDTEVLQSFRENDRGILAKRIFDKIENDYFAVFSIDLDAGIASVMKDEYGYLGREGTVCPFAPLMNKLADDYDGETRDFFLKMSDINYIKRRFAREDKSTYSYKSTFGDGTKWGNISEIVLTRHEDGTPSLFALGFTFLDEAANEKEELQVKVKEALSIAGGLASRYETLYYANLNEGTFTVYSLDGKRLPETQKIVNEGKDPLETLRLYGKSKLVHDEDKYLFTEITMDTIKEKLAHSKSFSIKFRRSFDYDFHWCEMDVVKYEDIDDPPNAVAIGFADVDTEIRSDQALQNCFSILSKDISPQESINELLSTAGDFYGAERCYIFEYANNKEVINNTYEWCAKDVEAMISQLQEIPSSEIDGWVKEFNRQGAFYMDALDEEGAYGSQEGRELLEMQGIQNLIAAPIMNGDEMIGFIGVDNPKKAKKNIDILQNVAVVVYSEILKIQQNQMAMYEYAKIFSDAFLDSYVSAYYVNLENCSQIVLHRTDYINENYGHIDNYLESIKKYIAECVYENDRQTMYEIVEPQYIQKRLKKEKQFSVYLRDISGEKLRWYRFDVTRGSDENHAGLAFTDVTEKLAEENEKNQQLENARYAAEAANMSKTNFLFNMSHDIRTPMNAITGFTNIAIKHIDDKEKTIDCLGKIQQSGNMLLSLINSVLEVSRIESGNAVLSEQPGDVYYSFSNIEVTLQELASSKNIKLTFEFGDIKDRYVFCDYSRCMRINTNIISNAIKYTPDGGTVTVRCEQIGEAENGIGKYQYTVTDNGIGMSEEFQKHVFEQFSREKTATVSGIQGTGLGMSVVKSFVDLMGGTIECKSKQGVGTTFTTVLPFRINTVQEYTDPVTGELVSSTTYNAAVKPVDFTGKKILLVDDSELNREVAVEILEEEGFLVEVAADGTEAVEILKEKGPDYYDFILMDIQMPVMDGYEATKQIRKMYPDSKLPVIALSANAFTEDKETSLAAGMNDHVAKPVNPAELSKVLARFI